MSWHEERTSKLEAHIAILDQAQEPADQHIALILDADGELQGVVFCLFCGGQNHSDEKICKNCGADLSGRTVERRLLMARISTYASHAGVHRRRSGRLRIFTFFGHNHSEPLPRRHKVANTVLSASICILILLLMIYDAHLYTGNPPWSNFSTSDVVFVYGSFIFVLGFLLYLRRYR